MEEDIRGGKIVREEENQGEGFSEMEKGSQRRTVRNKRGSYDIV